jgi:hypothetical protein
MPVFDYVRRSLFLRVALAAVAVLGASVLISEDATPSLASCSGYYCDVVPPSQIRIYHDNPDWNPTYTVWTRDFKTYVKESLAREWISSWPPASLQSGAMAVRNFGWWWVNNGPKGWLGGQCYHVTSHWLTSQAWGPGYPAGFTPQDIAKIENAVNSTWAVSRMTRGSTIFESYYKGYPNDLCGQFDGGPAPGHDMSQYGTWRCAEASPPETWTGIIRRYYFDNASQPGHVMVMDDMPAATEYNEPALGQRLRVFAINGSGEVRWNRHTRSSNSWSGWTTLPPPAGTCTSAPAALSYGTTHLWVFCQSTDRGVWARRYNGSSWEAWIPLGGFGTSGPAATEYGSQLKMYVRRENLNIWERTCPTSSNCSLATSWSGWVLVGGPPGGCTSSPAADWRTTDLYVFCRGVGAAGNPHAEIWYTQTNNGTSWAPWTSIGGGLASGPAATDINIGGYRVYAESTVSSGHTWQNYRASSSGPWSGWHQPFTDIQSQCFSTPGVSNLPPAPEYFYFLCRGSDHALWSRRWNPNPPPNGLWEAW